MREDRYLEYHRPLRPLTAVIRSVAQYIIIAAVILFGIYGFLTLTSFETRVLSHRTTRRAADLCPLRRLPRGQCRYANEHDGELIKVDS